MDRIIPVLSDTEREHLISVARSFVDTPFKHRGRTRNGMDCLGLFVMSFRELGYPMQDRKVYGRDPANDGMKQAAIAHFGRPIPKSQMRAGDAVLMRWQHQPNHVALLFDYPLGGLAVVHALAEMGRVVESRLGDPWPGRITDVFRP